MNDTAERLRTAKLVTFDPRVCAHLILVPSHYRLDGDGSCKCNDPNETIMRAWGYRWSKKENRWK